MQAPRIIEAQTAALRDELASAHGTIDRLERQVASLVAQLDLHQIRAREEMLSCVEQAKRTASRQIEEHAQHTTAQMGVVTHLEAEVARVSKELHRLCPTANTAHESLQAQGRQIQGLQESLQAQEAAVQRRCAALEAALEEAVASSQQACEAVDHRVGAAVAKAKKEREAEAAQRRDTEEMLRMCEATASRDREVASRELQAMAGNVGNLKELVLKQLKTDQEASLKAEGLLKEYAGNIAGQVAKAMNVAISVRIQENNALVDATLRARLPEYAEKADVSLARVRDPLTGQAAVVAAHHGEPQEVVLARAMAAMKADVVAKHAVASPSEH